MSWSVTAVGKGAAVSKSLAEQFDKIKLYKMSEPEAALAAKVGEALVTACAAIPDLGVIVKGYGSQSQGYKADAPIPTPVTTGLNMTVTMEAYPFAE